MAHLLEEGVIGSPTADGTEQNPEEYDSWAESPRLTPGDAFLHE